MNNLDITSLYAGILMLIAIALLAWVVKARGTAKVGLGDGGDKELLIRIRSQANFIENAPLLLIALALMESAGLPNALLHVFGAALVLSRMSHPIGMTNKYPKMPFRSGGTIVTLLLYLVAAITLIYLGLFT